MLPELIAYAKTPIPAKSIWRRPASAARTACQRRAIQDDDRYQFGARAVSQRGCGDDRLAERTSAALLRHHGIVARICQNRQTARAGGDHRAALGWCELRNLQSLVPTGRPLRFSTIPRPSLPSYCHSPSPLARSNYAGAAPRSPDLLPTELPRDRARLHICSIVNGLADRSGEDYTSSHAAARSRAVAPSISRHFSQAPATSSTQILPPP